MEKCLIIGNKLQECSFRSKQVTLHIHETNIPTLLWRMFSNKISHVFLYSLCQGVSLEFRRFSLYVKTKVLISRSSDIYFCRLEELLFVDEYVSGRFGMVFI